jgi:hypothetical protein
VILQLQGLLEVGPQDEEGLGLHISDLGEAQEVGGGTGGGRVQGGDIAGEDNQNLSKSREASSQGDRGDLREVAVEGADTLLQLQGPCVAKGCLWEG